MSGLNSRAQGFACVLALGMVVWLGFLAMTQFELGRIPLRIEGFYHAGLRKDQILNQTLPKVLAMGSAEDEGQFEFGGHTVDWSVVSAGRGTLSATLVRFEDPSQAGWPEGVGLRVEGRDGEWLLLDFR